MNRMIECASGARACVFPCMCLYIKLTLAFILFSGQALRRSWLVGGRAGHGPDAQGRARRSGLRAAQRPRHSTGDRNRVKVEK